MVIIVPKPAIMLTTFGKGCHEVAGVCFNQQFLLQLLIHFISSMALMVQFWKNSRTFLRL